MEDNMDNRDIEKKLQGAFSKAVPDVLDSVLQRCSEQGGSVIKMTENKRKKSLIYKIAAVAAAFVILLGGSIIAFNVTMGNNVATTVFFDVNPSVEILLNRDDRVLEVKALNADGEKIVGDMDMKNTDLDVAVNALVGSMLKNGYLSDIANSILISVDNDDPQKAAALQQRLIESINAIIGGASFDGSILSQKLSHDEKISELADKYGISLSKAQLISDIIEKNPLMTFEELSKLSINELNILRESGQISNENLQVTGDPSTNGYIGEQKAWSAAISDAANKAENDELKTAISKLTSPNSAQNSKIGMDVEDGRMVYEVEFTVSGYEYEYEIDAASGKVVSYDRERDDDNYSSSNGGSQQQTQGNSSGGGSQSSDYIGEQRAKEIALNNAGVSSSSATGLKIELDRENGIVVYDVSFDSNGYEYDYEINAVSGAIVRSDKERDDDYRANTAAGGASSQTQGSAQSASSSAVNYIGEQRAKEIAYDHAGVSASSVRASSAKLDRENGTVVYEVEFKSGSYEYDYDINATSGAVVRYNKEYDDDYRAVVSVGGASSQAASSQAQAGISSRTSEYIGEQRAKEAALNHAGVSLGSVRGLEIELDRDDGAYVYEVGFKANGYEYEYKINASTGAIIKHEKEKD